MLFICIYSHSLLFFAFLLCCPRCPSGITPPYHPCGTLFMCLDNNKWSVCPLGNGLYRFSTLALLYFLFYLIFSLFFLYFFFTFFQAVCPALMLIDLCRLQDGRGMLPAKMVVLFVPLDEFVTWCSTIESQWCESRVRFHTRKSNSRLINCTMACDEGIWVEGATNRMRMRTDWKKTKKKQ